MIKTMSPSTINTTVENIHNLLLAEGHTTWGFPIYQTVYSPDSEPKFTALLKTLTNNLHNKIPPSNDIHNLLPKFTQTIISKPTLENATADKIRTHFKSWSGNAIETEQPYPSRKGGLVRDERQINGDKNGDLPTLSPRYRFCLRINADSLGSFHFDQSGFDVDVDGNGRFVDLIMRDWTPSVPHVDRRTGKVYYGDRMREVIEGCDRRDVGWMRICLGSVLDMYEELGLGYNEWERLYRRPYEIVER